MHTTTDGGVFAVKVVFELDTATVIDLHMLNQAVLDQASVFVVFPTTVALELDTLTHDYVADMAAFHDEIGPSAARISVSEVHALSEACRTHVRVGVVRVVLKASRIDRTPVPDHVPSAATEPSRIRLRARLSSVLNTDTLDTAITSVRTAPVVIKRRANSNTPNRTVRRTKRTLTLNIKVVKTEAPSVVELVGCRTEPNHSPTRIRHLLSAIRRHHSRPILVAIQRDAVTAIGNEIIHDANTAIVNIAVRQMQIHRLASVRAARPNLLNLADQRRHVRAIHRIRRDRHPIEIPTDIREHGHIVTSPTASQSKANSVPMKEARHVKNRLLRRTT